MKKIFILIGFAALIGGAMFLVDGTNAADDGTTLGPVTPDGYDYSFAESCVNCKSIPNAWKNRYHQENVLGVEVTRDGAGNVTKVEKTGRGWLDSQHARSMDGPNANTYCAYCHGPGYETIADDPEDSKQIKKDKPGMGCVGCHPSHTIAAKYGTRYGNYLPGTDPSDENNWRLVPTVNGEDHVFDGKKANNQCLFCHTEYHGFDISFKEQLVKSGDLKCIDCHMAVYNVVKDRNLPERYHNFKVEANGPDACAECHKFKKKQMNVKIAELMGAHQAKKHKRPTF